MGGSTHDKSADEQAREELVKTVGSALQEIAGIVIDESGRGSVDNGASSIIAAVEAAGYVITKKPETTEAAGDAQKAVEP